MHLKLCLIALWNAVFVSYCASAGVLPNSLHFQTPTSSGPSASYEPSLRYIGCYDTWEASTGHYFGNFYNSGSVSPDYCIIVCGLLDVSQRENFVILVKDRYCACSYWDKLVNTRVDNKYCSIGCSDAEGRSCGGNYGFSAYCNSSFNACKTFEPGPIKNLYESEITGFPISQARENNTQIQLYLPCANCPLCFGTYYPRFDYLPRNSPEACVQFCRRRIKYWANGVKVRDPTPLAAVGWTKGKVPGISISSCACLDYSAPLEALSAEECGQVCPGDGQEVQICGGIKKFRFTVYLTGIPSIEGKIISQTRQSNML